MFESEKSLALWLGFLDRNVYKASDLHIMMQSSCFSALVYRIYGYRQKAGKNYRFITGQYKEKLVAGIDNWRPKVPVRQKCPSTWTEEEKLLAVQGQISTLAE